MAKSAEKIRPAKGRGKATKKRGARAKKPAVISKKFMLESNAAPGDPALIVAKPSTRSVSATSKSRTSGSVAKAKMQQPPPAVMAQVAQPDLPISSMPLPRSNAVIVWQRSGSMDRFFHWLRLSGREILRMYTNPPPREAALIGVKLRTKNELLRELAVLREENAIMRKRLGLPQMPFGRQIAGSI